MPDLNDFLNVNNEDRTEVDKGSLTEKWKGYFSDPRAQGAMLSIAGALAQPSWGGGMGHVMGALGAGGESVRQTEALDLKQQEAESKDTLRAAQGDLAGARADTAAAKAGTAGAMTAYQSAQLGLRERELEHKKLRSTLSNELTIQGLYNKDVKPLQKANESAALMRQPLQHIPSREEWMQQNKALLQSRGLDTTPLVDPFSLSGETATAETEAPKPRGVADSPAKPKTVRQNGVVYNLQPDGTYK